MLYIIGNPQFNNEEIAAKRNFKNVEEMNKVLIDKWNSIVNEKDFIIVIGNFGKGKAEDFKKILKELKGQKILLIGEKYNSSYSNIYWQTVGFAFASISNFYKDIEDKRFMFFANNYEKAEKDERIYCCGGDMFEEVIKDNIININCDLWDYSPINTDNLLNIYNNLKEEDNNDC